jgi:hypothetical protein
VQRCAQPNNPSLPAVLQSVRVIIHEMLALQITTLRVKCARNSRKPMSLLEAASPFKKSMKCPCAPFPDHIYAIFFTHKQLHMHSCKQVCLLKRMFHRVGCRDCTCSIDNTEVDHMELTSPYT